ncbi:protein GRAVITROPIC IN THE LIGHT 1-like [Tasmannia lanceolata]|uniref:protein GRAVITROPIC IN THE LIGHT 1-like n=1 Tax=Tasmannia lanceolata TaxID=3420 RepID=UPI004062FC34
MDSASKITKPSSNISDIVHRFAKVCRLTSIGVFSGGNIDDIPSIEDGSDATEATSYENDDQKIHPQPIEETLTKTHQDVVTVAAISKIFASVSSLKSAYIQLQEAHIPYDSEKVQSADMLVISQLKALSEIKHFYRERNAKPPLSHSSLFAEIQEYEILLEKLRTHVQVRDSEILRLTREIEELDRKNAEFEENIKHRLSDEESILFDLTPKRFSDVFEAASKSIHDFAKPLIALMKASGWNLDLAASSIEDSVVYARRADKKYAFEAYLSRRMFGGSTPRLDKIGDEDNLITKIKDPFDALIENPDSNFGRFCRSKYLSVVHSSMEQSFFGNLDQRAFVLSSGHPRTPFYQAFVKMSRWVWVLLAMAASMNPKAEMFLVRKGSGFSEVYMENVGKDVVEEGEGKLKVGLMVMPGFRIGRTVIRSRVYLSLCGVKSSLGAC